MSKAAILTSGVLIMFAIMSSPAWAQWGIKMGPAFSGFQPSHSDSRYITGEDFRPFLGYEVDYLQDKTYGDLGLQIGVFYAKYLTERAIVQPELYYAHRGLNFELLELYNLQYQLDINYLQLSLPFKYKLSTTRKVNTGILLGAFMSYKLSGKRTLVDWEAKDTKSLEGINTTDFGMILGFDSEFSAWSQPLLLELRIEYGFGSMMHKPDDFTPIWEDTGITRDLAIIMMMGYRFGTKRSTDE